MVICLAFDGSILQWNPRQSLDRRLARASVQRADGTCPCLFGRDLRSPLTELHLPRAGLQMARGADASQLTLTVRSAEHLPSM